MAWHLYSRNFRFYYYNDWAMKSLHALLCFFNIILHKVV